MRPNALFAMLSFGFALLGSGCPATYITVSSEGGAGGTGVGGASGAIAIGGSGGATHYDDCAFWYPLDSDDYWNCVNGGGASGQGGVGGAPADCDCYGGAGGDVGQPCVGGAGGYGGFGGEGGYGGFGGEGGYGGYGGIGGIGGYGGTGIGGVGGDPCNQFAGDPPAICNCYYGLNNPEYYGCLNRHDAQNGGVGGAPSVLCEEFAPWSDEHERCVNYYLNGGVGSFVEADAGESVDAGSPE